MPDSKNLKPDRPTFTPPVDTLTPGLSLDRIGQALASFYDDLIAEGVPEHLAAHDALRPDQTAMIDAFVEEQRRES